jgi:tetratricopeptide (TPR) repeat protein
MRPHLRFSIVLGLALQCAAAGAASQLAAQSGSLLDSVEREADLGRVEAARTLLSDWFGSAEASDRGADVERARFLRARLSADLDSARVDYLWVAVRGGDRYGAAARLRLAQMYVAEGRLDRAAEDLDTMRRDYPGHSLIFESWLWTGNVRAAAGDLDGACTAWRSAASTPGGQAAASDRDLIRAALEDCGAAAGSQAPQTFSVQLGAFSSRETAEDLRGRVMSAGATARVVDPAESGGLYRVRSGRFSGREEAARHAVRLAEQGFESIVVPGEP